MYLFIAVALFFIALPALGEEKDYSVFLRHGSTVYSESVPIKLFADDLRGGSPPVEGNHALTHNRLEVGFSWQGIELAHFLREDYVFNYSRDTMNIVYRDKNKLPIPSGRAYDIYLNVQHIKAEGWRLGYRFDLQRDSYLRLSLNYLKADELLYGTMAGQVTVRDGDINGGNLKVLYYYHEDYLLDRPGVIPASGTGYSIDVEADIDLGKGWAIQLNLYDLLGQIYWDDAPFTQATVASTSTYYDSDGYAHRDPVMQAREAYRNFTQNLPIYYQISVRKHLFGPLGFSYTREKYDQVDFDRAFLRYRLTEHMDWITGYDFKMESAWVGLTGKAVSLDVATDDWSFVDSKSLVLRLHGRFTF